ncbi:hypothetical protein CTAYLR_004530 [Chrysophaeum taylorii]|uniref:Uncharacterized protein n=1 Tax=Chrysophaeum taylorii TaxID=2483200 RepID=A0AAD7UNN8_9STRA|nr:hypothetical protein CTAYLR_004530 [Chrysophaeum taylorii]
MSFLKAMDAMTSRVRGENMSAELTAEGVGDARVALFAALVRGAPEARILDLVTAVMLFSHTDPQAPVDLVVMAFQTRDCRGGKGERALFYVLFREIFNLAPETALGLLDLVPSYGYWKDLFVMHEKGPERLQRAIISLVADQLRRDASALDAGDRVSLAAKYAPRQKRRFDCASKALAAALFGTASDNRKRYRQLVARLTAALDTPEVKMCARRWAEIDASRVPSLCLARSRKGFLNEKLHRKRLMTKEEDVTGDRFPTDEDRVKCRKALRAAAGKRIVKGKQLFPHDLVRTAMGFNTSSSTLEADVLDAQWAQVVQSVAKTASPLDGSVALVDVSGSMSGQPMQVAIALGLLVAQLAAPAYANRVLTFESTPRWFEIDPDAKLVDKVRSLQRAPWGGSTNFAAAIDLILDACVQHDVKPDEIPDLVVFSDMQFDLANGVAGAWQTHHERLVQRFAEAGKTACGQPWDPPMITFWNLRGDTHNGGFMVEADKPGCRVLGGFSPALLKFVLEGEQMIQVEDVLPDGSTTTVKVRPTPYDTMRHALDDPRYDAIRLKLAASTESPFAPYTFTPSSEEEEEEEDATAVTTNDDCDAD